MPAGHANPELYEKTFVFAFFIYSIIFNSINTRSETINVFEHINENRRFIWVMGAIFIMQTIIIQVGGAVFGTVALTPKALLIAIGLALLIIPVDMLRKLIMRTGKKN
jgi:magnesium-transporting ATPase (P-type)